ncbi:MAG TPA: hypothetical protein VIT23_12340, partial [Terrimicrobiaceae bacterium]
MEQTEIAAQPPPVGDFRKVEQGMSSKEMRYRAEDICRLAFLVSDSVAAFAALITAYYVRFDFFRYLLPPESFLAPSHNVTLANYEHSILLGTLILFVILFLKGAYEGRALLRFRRFFFLLLKALLIWIIALSGISLILQVDEFLSRVYVVISFGLLLTFVACSR